MPLTDAPTLSVIMTVYNGEVFIQETLDAVWAQSFEDFEMLVVNNGSTDGTQAILDANEDPRLRVVQAPSHGTFGDGIRLAYQHARGKYIAVQDADDVSHIDRFAKQVVALDADKNLGLVCSGFQHFYADGSLGQVFHPPSTDNELLDTFQVTNPLAHSTYMYRQKASEEVGGYPAEYQFGPDFALSVRLLKKGWRVQVLDDVLIKLRIHAGQTSHNPKTSVMRAHDTLFLLNEAAQLEGASNKARRAGYRARVKARLQYAMALIGNGTHASGLKQLAKAVLLHPPYAGVYLGYRFLCELGVLRSRQT